LAIKPIPRPTCVARMHEVLAPLVLCLAACGLACSHLPPPRPRPPANTQAPSTALPLPPAANPAAQRELRLTLPAGTYVRLAILSTSPDLVVRQLGSDGRTAEEQQLTGGGIEPIRLSWVTARAGEHRWTVEPRNPRGPPGAHAIALEEERPAGPCDEARMHAERAVLAAHRELNAPRPDAAAAARALLEPAVAGAAETGERKAVLAAQLELARTAARQQAADGVRLYERALDLARELGDRPAEAEALQGLADLLPDTRKLETLRAALEIRQQLGDEAGESYVFYLLGYYYKTHGDTASALRSYHQALALQWRNEDVSNQAWTLCEIGALYGRQQELERAGEYLEVGLERGRAAGNLEAQAYALSESARLEIDLGELQTACDDYRLAHELLATSGSGIESAMALEGLGRCLLYLGEPERARQMFGDALSEFQASRHSQGQAWTLLGIGAALEAEHDAAGALHYFRKAMDIIREGSLHALEGVALYDLGKVHRELGQPTQAIAELERAVALEASDSPVRQAQTLLELANAHSQAGDTVRAKPAFQRAIQLSGRAPLVEAAARAGLARLDRDHGELVAARSAIRRALEITEELRAGVVRPDQRVSFLAARRAYYEFDVDLLMRCDRLERGAGRDAEALAASEQARARELLDLLARERVDLRHRMPPELEAREVATGERIALLQTRLWSATESLPATDIQRLKRELNQAEDEEKELDAEIRRRQPAYAAVRAPRPLLLSEIQGLLDNSTALLEFFVGEESSYLFVVTRQGLATHPLPPRRQLEPLVERVHAAVEQDSRFRGRHFAEDAYQLYRLLLLPASGDLRGKSRLIIAPDGPFHSLNFEVLLTAAVPGGGPPRRDLPYLIRERSVSYVPSASVLAQLLTESRRRGEADVRGKLFVGFGDPSEASSPAQGTGAAPLAIGGCDRPGGPGGWRRGGLALAGVGQPRPLPAAHDEVCRIAKLFPADEAVVFLGRDASEENVKTSASVTWARNLHFAAHGLLEESSPERSGLRLAHASSTEDGLLQVREVFNLDLHADLVVLSACQSGLGKAVSGEGLIGMTRAFLYAGAGSVVVSLWQVDDNSTSDLMVSFYRHLQEVGDKTVALRHAKLELIDRSRYVHPYFWAPFILIGRPQ